MPDVSAHVAKSERPWASTMMTSQISQWMTKWLNYVSNWVMPEPALKLFGA
jgi:hypothetical protein